MGSGRVCPLAARGEGAVARVMVYAVEQGERHVYCSSPPCIAALVKLGWRLSDATQLTALIRELATAPQKTHEPSDHFR